MNMRGIVGVVVISLAGLTTPAQAQHNIFEYQVDVSVNNLVDTRKVTDVEQGPINLQVDDPGIGTANGMAFVGYGVNQAVSHLIGYAPDTPVWLGYSLSTSMWWDTVTISSPDLNGSPGTFTATLLVQGTGSFTASDTWIQSPDVDIYGQWLARIRVVLEDGTWQEDGWNGGWEKDPDAGTFTYFGDPLNRLEKRVTFSFIYGEPFALGGLLQTYLSQDNFQGVPGVLDATIDLGNAAYWGGIKKLRDANGTRVKRATLTSNSGRNWLKPYSKQ